MHFVDELDSKKNFLSEVDTKSIEGQQKTEDLQNMNSVQRKKLESLSHQQTYSL